MEEKRGGVAASETGRYGVAFGRVGAISGFAAAEIA
jgi:hypothetical protein